MTIFEQSTKLARLRSTTSQRFRDLWRLEQIQVSPSSHVWPALARNVVTVVDIPLHQIVPWVVATHSVAQIGAILATQARNSRQPFLLCSRTRLQALSSPHRLSLAGPHSSCMYSQQMVDGGNHIYESSSFWNGGVFRHAGSGRGAIATAVDLSLIVARRVSQMLLAPGSLKSRFLCGDADFSALPPPCGRWGCSCSFPRPIWARNARACSLV